MKRDQIVFKECPFCHVQVRVRVDGKFALHSFGSGSVSEGNKDICAGSGSNRFPIPKAKT
ncbi:MAG: hypothetical protein ACREMT_07770 [Vulcanimicrobiaceae bacterium]